MAAIGKTLRLAEFWQEDRKSILIDATLPGALGPLLGLESPARTVQMLAPLADGLILNPGIAEAHAAHFLGKQGAAPLIRLDWTNIFRPADHALPPRSPQRVQLATPTDAVQIGACAAVASLLLGYDEEFEAQNIQALSFAARECARVALPLLVDVHLAGPKIDPAKFDAAVQLGVGFMVEAGADGIFLPLPGKKALDLLLSYAPVPLFLRVDTAADLTGHAGGLCAALDAGVAGLVLGSATLMEAETTVRRARELIRFETEAVR